MPVLLDHPADLQPVPGVNVSCARAGFYDNDRSDLALIEIERGGTCTGVFTRNAFAAAPVLVARQHLESAIPRYLLVNAGNANAGTGKRGVNDAIECCEVLAAKLGCNTDEILPFSTGVIGEYLPVKKMAAVFDGLVTTLAANNWLGAAQAIMTTDTVPKAVSRTMKVGSKSITVSGIAKGSGMICPDMATMLAFVATDAGLDKTLLQEVLEAAVGLSFNRITVDGDTSTNDACMLLASGKSGIKLNEQDTSVLTRFQHCVNEVCTDLAQSIVRDGEGATKFITVRVQGGKTGEQCKSVAQTIANSPLVKTAMYASDPNWGRILMALGRAPADGIDADKVDIFLNSVCIVDKGVKSDTYTEEQGKQAVSEAEITILVDLGLGKHEEIVWTCDMSHEYIRINAEYRS